MAYYKYGQTIVTDENNTIWFWEISILSNNEIDYKALCVYFEKNTETNIGTIKLVIGYQNEATYKSSVRIIIGYIINGKKVSTESFSLSKSEGVVSYIYSSDSSSINEATGKYGSIYTSKSGSLESFENTLESELPIFTSVNDVLDYFKTGSISKALNKSILEPDLEPDTPGPEQEDDPISEPPEFDWTKSMQQTFEFYKVDPVSWKDVARINNVKSCTISRDYSAETLGSANIDGVDDLGECYIRVYLITIQNGITKKHPLGTFLVQTPSSKFDGKVTQTSLDAYTPLLELKENPPPIGYYIPKKTNVMEIACQLARDHARVPIVETECDIKLSHDFVADTNDTWLSLLSDLIANAKYVFDLDELSRIIFSPKQDTASLRPVWTYDDGNSSILYPELNNDYDLYGVPNVVEVVYSDTTGMFYSKAVNDDPNSPTSIVNRGREITKRITNPDIVGSPSQKQLDEYANNLLRAYSSMECTITYSHGYCPVRPGDCVMLNYEKAGLVNVKAKVISQSIECTPGCKVTETAVYTRKVWG